MQSLASRYVHNYLKFKSRRHAVGGLSLEAQRQRLEDFAQRFRMPKNVAVEKVQMDSVPCEWLRVPGSRENCVLLYLHGGAYCAGSLNTHRRFVADLALEFAMDALLVDYRLAPELPFPAALDDAMTVYARLRQERPDADIIVAGDSAGGGLSLALLLRLKSENGPMPGMALLLGPWVDLVCENESYRTVGDKEVMLDQARLKRNARMYAGEETLTNPLISPIYADLSGLPPVLIQTGTYDFLSGEAQMVAEQLEEAGGKVVLEVWPKMIHSWQFLNRLLPEARRAIRSLRDFIRDNLLNIHSSDR